MHSIEDEMVFSSNPRFIFHDSRGFESGSDAELKMMDEFITKRAVTTELKDQLHVIWYEYISGNNLWFSFTLTGIVYLWTTIDRYWKQMRSFSRNSGYVGIQNLLKTVTFPPYKQVHTTVKLGTARALVYVIAQHSILVFRRWCLRTVSYLIIVYSFLKLFLLNKIVPSYYFLLV
jgi:hypothetical protein